MIEEENEKGIGDDLVVLQRMVGTTYLYSCFDWDEENQRQYAVSFFKENLGCELKVLCDYSFLRWCCLRQKDPDHIICKLLQTNHVV
ncbi:hypothetical protein E3N88_02530 [Mikania micrantha]|uniref:Uncharacterized protein n=1 Tax=Mikania micrantha TaxID=192012 RepID=A0A5N6Q411_9ASTR|nr:hypothetical protein E3N88_02530 [Mikania micrantha]